VGGGRASHGQTDNPDKVGSDVVENLLLEQVEGAIQQIAEALEEEERGTLFQIKRLRDATEHKRTDSYAENLR
jgi:hypothetical protein